MPITPKPLNQSTSNKKVTPITFYSDSKTDFKFQKGGQKSPPPLKTQKMPIIPKPLNQSTSNKKVTPITFYSESKNFSKFENGGSKSPPF